MSKLYNMLGLAMRARKVVSGEEQVLSAVRSKTACLVLISNDAAPNAKKKLSDKCAHYHIPWVEVGSRSDLGRAIGKAERVTVAVTEPGFADAIKKWCE
ncbi:L7Ae/L30e/S12e/Gadd45 family ribosomal protein [Melghirimyces algeriensis]|uniref:LSU ribosomal protein L7AE n=1 Tax=Melghirimyces algeriensis TaxID=910412 RepID=A0A521C2T0_9BACL|nr:ribosomal L7Ae/L30e/S12e/Gadd45 family protein [Melghirimyces algeriensis]SMO53709.1 LSU ribosomal protein L7AE [Melghirimyces algeriensis]